MGGRSRTTCFADRELAIGALEERLPGSGGGLVAAGERQCVDRGPVGQRGNVAAAIPAAVLVAVVALKEAAGSGCAAIRIGGNHGLVSVVGRREQ